MPPWLEKILAEPTTTVPLAGKAIGLSRNSSYGRSRGEIPTLQFGRLKRVPTSWIRQILQLPIRHEDRDLDVEK
jgi:hypothetical protein